MGVPVLWQFRQILESFGTGSIIQGAYMEVTEQKNVYMRKCCLQNIKMSDTRWAFFFFLTVWIVRRLKAAS